jgi:hypothetical protein
MTNSQDGKSHGSDRDQLDALLKRLFERAKAGENSNQLYQNEYVNSVLGKRFNSYVKQLKIAAYDMIDGKEPSIREEKLRLDESDMKVTPPKIPEGYWK